jgi:hypothetical protein
LNVFVVPQYPEIGWDAVQEQPVEPVEEHPQDNMNVMEELGMENQQSMVLNLSDNSSDSVNMVGAAQVPGAFDVIQVGRVEFGPILPPPLMWDRLMHSLLPELYAKSIPISMRLSPFSFLKRKWEAAFEFKSCYVHDRANDKRVVVTVKPRIVDENFSFSAQAISSTDMAGSTAVDDSQKAIGWGKAKVLDAPVTDSVNVLDDATLCMPVLSSISSCSTPVNKTAVRRKKQSAPLDPSFQRVTRSVSVNKGFRAAPLQYLQPQPKKRTRKVEPSSAVRDLMRRTPVASDKTDKEAGSSKTESAAMVSIPVMQRIGDLLQMDPEDLTVAKLTAEPSVDDVKQPEVDD